MKANPDKFQAIAIGKNTLSKKISFNLNGNIIKTEDEVKLCGVTIDYELKFNSCITNICRKASRQLNVLKRMGKYLNRLGKLTIYMHHSFILSNFIYCPVICHFCSEANTKKTGLTLEGKEVALWLLTLLCTSAKREVEVAL